MMLNYTFGDALDDGDPCSPVEDNGICIAILDIKIPRKAPIGHEFIDDEAFPSCPRSAKAPQADKVLMPQRGKHAEAFQEVGLLRLAAALVDALDRNNRAISHDPLIRCCEIALTK